MFRGRREGGRKGGGLSQCLPCPGMPSVTSGADDHPELPLKHLQARATTSRELIPCLRVPLCSAGLCRSVCIPVSLWGPVRCLPKRVSCSAWSSRRVSLALRGGEELRLLLKS